MVQQYYDLLQEVIDKSPRPTPDRTGKGRHRLFGRTLRFDLSKGVLPLVTKRKIYPRAALRELVWMIKGCGASFATQEDQSVPAANVGLLKQMGGTIWDDWYVTEKDIQDYVMKFHPETGHGVDVFKMIYTDRFLGTIGPMYGALWRNITPERGPMIEQPGDVRLEDIPSDRLMAYKAMYAMLNEDGDESKMVPFEEFACSAYFSSIDQLGMLVANLKNDPYSSRHVVSVWDPRYVPDYGYSPQENVLRGKGALAACHFAFQCFVDVPEEGQPHILNLKVTQRSADLVLGVPTNLVFYSALLLLLAKCTGMIPGELIWEGGDVHIYGDHIEGVKEFLAMPSFEPPVLTIDPELDDFFQVALDSFTLSDYQSGPVFIFARAV